MRRPILPGITAAAALTAALGVAPAAARPPAVETDPPVHVDLVSGQTVVTGNEVMFHLPGVGVVFGQAGRLVTGADGALLSFTGMSTVDAAALCAALAP